MQEDQDNQKHGKGMRKKPISRIGVFDAESGEVLDEGRMIYVPHRMKIKGFFMANQMGFEDLAKSALTGEALKVLMLMMARMDYENKITVSQKEIAETLMMKRQNVHRAIKSLRITGLIKVERDHISLLTIDLGWKGKVSNMHKREALLKKEFNERTKHCAEQSAMIDAKINALPKFLKQNQKSN